MLPFFLVFGSSTSISLLRLSSFNLASHRAHITVPNLVLSSDIFPSAEELNFTCLNAVT